MKVAFTFRNVESSEGVKTYASEKIGKLQKYVRAPLDAEVVLSMERHLQRVDISVSLDGRRYSGTESSEDMYASIDVAIDKIDRQVRDAKATATTRKRHGVTAAEVATQLTAQAAAGGGASED